jgi:hypothetical protein
MTPVCAFYGNRLARLAWAWSIRYMRSRLRAAWHWVQRVFLAAHPYVKEAEPWGIWLAVIGFGFTIWSFQIERADREEDRINRAISLFGDGLGRIDALSVLLRNDVSLEAFKAPKAFLPRPTS